MCLAGLSLAVTSCATDSSNAATGTVVVDGQSLGGRCWDARPAADVSVHKPWCSLARAADAGSGATVLVRAGTYPRLSLDGFHGKIAFRGYRGERPTIQGIAATNASGYSFSGFRFTGENDMTNVSDFSFVDNQSRLKPRGDQTLSGYLVTGGSNGLWQRNTVSNGWMGVHFRWGGAKNMRILDNRFQRLGGEGVHIQQGERVLVARNRFVDILPRADMVPGAHADAVQCLGPSRNVVFDGNEVSGGRGFMIQFAPADYGMRAAQTGMVVRNNVFTGPDFGIRVFSAPGIRILHNRVWGSGVGPHSGVDLQAAVGSNLQTTGAVLRNNVIKQLDVAPGVTYSTVHNRIHSGPRR